MSAATLLRGISGVALPALALITLRRRRAAHSSDAEQETQPSSLSAPSTAEVRRLIDDESSLARLNLSGIDLRRADLRGRDLRQSDLSYARLSKARLSDADLSQSSLDFSDMTGCDLRGASLIGASLIETSLWDADLRGADLSQCRNIVMANLRRARYDSTTRWPARLDPKELGAMRVDKGRRPESGRR